MTASAAPSGRIFDIQRFAIHDGPGIRTTVFLKGCPLRCWWCHNPEAVAPRPQLSFAADRCIGCAACADACPRGVHCFDADGHTLDRSACEACGRCAAVCPVRGLEIVGREVTVGEVIAEVERDRAFYQSSGGGMTLSGGEPLAQPGFAAALLTAARGAGIHTAVETCGAVSPTVVERVRPLVDLFLYDLKETDERRHRDYTGAGLERIVGNLYLLHDAGAKVRLRLPLIPGLNDRAEHFRAVVSLVRDLPRLEGVEVMPYHRLGEGKRERLGLDPAPMPATEPPSPNTVGGWLQALRSQGVRVFNE